MTTATTAANPFDRQYNKAEHCYDVIDTRTGALIRSFFIEDGAAAMRALELADALWYNELIGASEVSPEPTEPSEVIEGAAPEPIAITDPDQIPAALVAAAWGLVPDEKHAHNEGRWYLLTWQHQPALWAGIWAAMSLTERDEALAKARLAGATPYELSAMAGASLFHDSAPVELTRAA